jgi:hypothetical protein
VRLSIGAKDDLPSVPWKVHLDGQLTFAIMGSRAHLRGVAVGVGVAVAVAVAVGVAVGVGVGVGVAVAVAVGVGVAVALAQARVAAFPIAA